MNMQRFFGKTPLSLQRTARRVTSLLVLVSLSALVTPGVTQAQDLSPTEQQVELVSREAENGDYEFYAVNNHVIPVWLNVAFPELINMEASVDLPYNGLIEADGEETFLFRLHSSGQGRRRGYSVRYRYARGDPRTVVHDDSYIYLLPFAHGEKYRVTQGYHGAFTHHGENTYAVDFDMVTGTPVHAARAGVVIEVKQDSTRGGPSARYSSDANYVLIMHSDGSFGNYVHLRPNGAAVQVGDKIYAGDLVGYSGDTGQSSGPHLHFDVRVPQRDGRMQSIPTQFLNHEQREVSLEESAFYYAYHPGKPEFEVVLGNELRASDFADYEASIASSDRIEFRTEDVDLTYVLYIANGFDEAMELEIDIRMRGVRSDEELPIAITLEPRTERFLTLLRAVPGATQLQFAPSVRYSPVR
ncbi:MAG: M23 family metallopeptidase [Spirochaeta sp.]|nr:M23 family metallopeptidase [Spirochaeta sp.]